MKTIGQCLFFGWMFFLLSGCISLQLNHSISKSEKIGVLSVYGRGDNDALNDPLANAVKNTLVAKGYPSVMVLKHARSVNDVDFIKLSIANRFFMISDPGQEELRTLAKQYPVENVVLITDDPYTTEMGGLSPLLSPRPYRSYLTGVGSWRSFHIENRFKVYVVRLSDFKVLAQQFGFFSIAIPYRNWESCQLGTTESKKNLQELIRSADQALIEDVEARVNTLF